MRDGSGSNGYLRVGIAAATSEAAALSALWSLAGLLASASGAVPVEVSVAYPTVVTDARGPVGSEVGTDLVMVFGTVDEGEYAVIRMPGAADDMFGPDGGALPDDVRVAALAAALVAGPYANPFGVELTTLLTAFRGDRREA